MKAKAHLANLMASNAGFMEGRVLVALITQIASDDDDCGHRLVVLDRDFTYPGLETEMRGDVLMASRIEIARWLLAGEKPGQVFFTGNV